MSDLDAKLRAAISEVLPCWAYTLCVPKRHPPTCPAHYRAAVLEAIAPIIAEAQRDAAKLREALIEVRELMGGESGGDGWDSPEDVWGIANAALSAARTPEAGDGE